MIGTFTEVELPCAPRPPQQTAIQQHLLPQRAQSSRR